MLVITPQKLNIVLFEDIHQNAVDFLASRGLVNITKISGAMSGEELKQTISKAHIVGIRSRTIISEDVIAAAENLMVIGCFCIGTNQIDIDAASERGIVVFNAPHSNTRSVAEMVISFAIILMRDLYRKSINAHQGKWLKTSRGSHEIRGKTMGIIGYGHIGSQVSVLAESLGMRVVYHDIARKQQLGNAKALHSLSEVLQQSDVITLHVPDTPLTKNLINVHSLAQCKREAVIINASRGNTVDIEALQNSLQIGHIAGAAIDVFPQEPKSHDEKFVCSLQGMEQVIMTPHVGGSTEEAQENIGMDIAYKINNWAINGSTESSVNFPSFNVGIFEGCQRIAFIHKNIPGMLHQANKVIGELGININKQHLETKGNIGYLVFDIDATVGTEFVERLNNISGTIDIQIFKPSF